MRVLWITNTIFPAPSKALNISPPIFGGWMYGLATQISKSHDYKLAVATTYNGSIFRKLKIDEVIYYLLPAKSTVYMKYLEPYWLKVCNDFCPELVHIHGTENTHGLYCMRVCPTLNYVVSIQGLISVISTYYFGNISKWDILKNITLRDVIKSDTLFQGKKEYKLRGALEKEYILKTKHVIGRTSWDFAHVISLNPKVNYHFCNESLRECFYKNQKWSINEKNNYSIFISQASYPIKGLHQVLKAISFLKNDFPEIRVRIAGKNMVCKKNLAEKIKRKGYGSYIGRLIKKLCLDKHIQFIGTLTEEEMVNEYLHTHVYICSSIIENSPNSLGEAQILGVPCIATYVGGIPDFVSNSESGLLYRFEEVEMLAENIRKIFTDDSLALHLSINAIKAAEMRHNLVQNFERTIEIYNKVLNINQGMVE